MHYIFLAVAAVFLSTGCADSVDFTLVKEVENVGFLYGFWHGMIAGFAFIISLFDESVSVYAVYNSGGWYDFGFILGIMLTWGGGCKMKCQTPAAKKRKKEWEDVGEKVEVKIMHKLKEWAEDDDGSVSRQEWEDIGEKVEQKLKRKIREWTEKE